MEDGEKLELPDKLQHLNNLDLDPEQIKRYLQQYELLGREVFQEFPSTPEEAFLTTGDTVRDATLIKWLKKQWYLEDEKYRSLRIYWKPGPCMYGIDLAEGWANWDYSSISVRTTEGKLLAFYYDKAPHDFLVEVTDYLVWLWFIGTIWPEVNAGGIAYINKAKEYERIDNVYTRVSVDSKTNKRTKKYWWQTNKQTRDLAIREYEEAVRTGVINEVDERLRSEMYSFVYNDKKKPEALLWSHDDAIMSDAICRQMRHEYKTRWD